jgi:hypothetical protein
MPIGSPVCDIESANRSMRAGQLRIADLLCGLVEMLRRTPMRTELGCHFAHARHWISPAIIAFGAG